MNNKHKLRNYVEKLQKKIENEKNLFQQSKKNDDNNNNNNNLDYILNHNEL